jgi:nucleoid DNA-binding protein
MVVMLNALEKIEGAINNGQSRKLATLGTQEIERRQAKQKTQQRNLTR